MKKQHFIWILASLLAFAGCDEDKSPYAPTGGEALRIDASVEEIVLDPANNAQTAVTFTWNRGYTYGSAVSVEYCFKMDIADNNFATATDLEVLGPDVFERSFTVEELNDLCLERWGITPGESARLEGKVIARLTADKFLMPGVATTAFDVQTYELPSAPLYLLGDAVEVDGAALGWEPSKAVAMTEEVLSRQYSYKAVSAPANTSCRDSARACFLPSSAGRTLPRWSSAPMRRARACGSTVRPPTGWS